MGKFKQKFAKKSNREYNLINILKFINKSKNYGYKYNHNSNFTGPFSLSFYMTSKRNISKPRKRKLGISMN